ncbi:MAG: PQQ-dependent sugar dehydrogenase [Patescibacteria group bacterium]|jgi:glucose/arabinose dehydrogenase
MFKLRSSRIIRVLTGVSFALMLVLVNALNDRPAQAEVSGLVTHLKFDNASTDAVGTNDFTLRGTASYSTQVAPVIGSTASLFIDGGVESQALGGDALFHGWTGGSVSFWVRINGATAASWANSSDHDLFFKDKVLQSRVFKDETGQLRYMTTHGNGTVFGTWITSTSSIPVDSWVHVVSTHTGMTTTIYFNGQLAGSGNTGVTLGSVDPNNRFEISTYDGRFAGYLDDVQFYNRAITQAEAAELATGGGVPPQLFTVTASASAGGTITPSGAVSVASGTNQVFSITPNSGYQIDDVVVDGASQGALSSYTFTNVASAHTISASFSLIPVPTYTITATAGANGTVTPSGSTVLNQGASQTYTITPNSGYQISDVIVDGVSQGAVASYAFNNVTANHTISADFTVIPPNSHTISASAGANGSISPSGSIVLTEGANQTFTITANSGYQIAGVLVDGISQGAIASYTFTNVTASHTISATFSLIPPTTFTITASAGANGSITPSGSVVVNTGANQTFTITANSGYQIAGVLVDGVSQGAIASYTFTNVVAAHTISASFSQIPQGSYTITATAGTGGTISPSGSVVVSAGQTQVFNIAPTGNYQISSVLVDGVSVGAVSSYVFSSINANHTIAATFSTATPPEGTFQLDNAYITGLASPTAMAYAPDGRLFITEQAGSVRIVTPEGQLLPTPFLVTSNMRSDEERGLLGIAFDPNFTTNNYVYIFYTENSLGARLSRFTANGNVVVPGSEVILLEYYNISGNHRGGDIHFGPDGKLYLGLGDAGEPLESQSATTYNGKMLRLNSDGTIPSDNPTTFVNTSGQTLTTSGQYRAIWAMGLRNPYRFSFHATNGKMHINDVGAGLWEEVNVGQAGRNYGWPTCEGLCSNAYAENPIYVHERGIEGCAVTGGAFYTGNQFPSEYNDDYFVIDYCSTWLRYLNAANNASATFPLSIPMFSVDLKVATDGSLLIAGHGSGTISRLYFVANSTNHNPVAVASADPVAGPAPLLVNFDGSASTDQDNDTLSYAWNFGDSATATGITASHTYAVGGSYTASLTVTDGNGGSHTDTVNVMVGAPPTASIVLPVEDTFYTAGDTIAFSGEATDPDDGVLPASAYSWTVLFHHDAHIHPHLGPITGVTSSTFSVPTFGHTEENVFYRIYLTVTDSNGLQTTVTRDVLPRKATVTIASNIPGVEILLDGSPLAAPYTFVGVAGVQRTIGVNSPQTIAGQGYEFGSWSDAGAQSHVIVTPSATTTYTVNMNVQTTPTLPAPSIHWKFNSNLVESILGTTTVGRGSIAYATDTPAIAGANTASLKFNGAVGTYIATNGTDLINGWSQATTSTWVKITSTTANAWTNNSYHALLFKYRVLQTRIQKTSTGLKLVAAHSDAVNPFATHIVSTTSIPTDTWVNLVTVHQGNMVTLYINGQLAGSGSTGRVLGGASTDGLDIIGHGGNYSGLFDDLRLYNTAFSEAQVQQIPLQ